MATTDDKRTVYVGGLVDDELTKALLADAFTQFGDIVDIRVPIDRETQKHRGFAFVEYSAAEGAAAAIANMNCTQLMGRTLIRCTIAKPQKKNDFEPTTKRKAEDEGESSVPEKKQSMEIEPPSPLPPPANVPFELLSMNDDCIEELLTYLPLKVLCATSKVCKRLQTLSETVFKCTYGTLAWIDFNKDSWDDEQQEEYEKCFGHFIENVSIFADGEAIGPSILDSLSFGYKQIEFVDTKFTDPVADRERMQKLVEKAEKIKFTDCEVGNLFDNLLKYCACLKSLIVEYMYKHTEWMLQTYPLLQQIQLIDCSDSVIETLPLLLQRNPTVKSLSLHHHDVKLVKRTLKKIIEQTASIEELFLDILGDGGEAGLKCVYDELKQLCGRQHFKRLELKLFGIDELHAMRLRSMSSLNKLTGIYLKDCDLNFASIESVALVRNVKTLGLSIRNRYELNIDRNRWPNLQEMFLDFKGERDFGKYILPFVRDLPQLRKIFTEQYNLMDAMHDNDHRIRLFADYRSKLKDAVKLNIYVDEKTFEELEEPFEELNAINGLVRVKVIKRFDDHPNVENPLIPFTYMEI